MLNKLLTFFVGTFLCFTLHQHMQVPVVLAAALTGLIGSFWRWPAQYGHHPQAAIYAGAFAGMCSSEWVGSWAELGVIAVIGAVLYTLTRNVFEGFGGRLGAIAFAAVCSVLVVKAWLWIPYWSFYLPSLAPYRHFGFPNSEDLRLFARRVCWLFCFTASCCW